MMRVKFTLILFSLVVCAKWPAFSQSTQPVFSQIIATNPVVPLIKGQTFNQLIKLGVYVPRLQKAACKNFELQLDANAVKAIEKIEVIVRNETERSFLAGAVTHGSANKLSPKTNIPVDLPLKQGWNTIWFSAVLKSDADIDNKIFAALKSITTTGNTIHPVKQQVNSNKRRLGIAVRKAWDDSVHTYRIPGITFTDKGTLVAVYDIRYKNSRDLPADIDVGMSRSTDGGHTWEPMKVIMDMGAPNENNGIGDPAVLFDPHTKKIWVSALWSKGNRSIAGSKPGLSPDSSGQFVLVSSDDDGLTWSEPYNITAQVKNPSWHLYFNGPGNGIVMQNGTLVFPSQYWDETTKPFPVGIPHSSIIYSNDGGKTWKSGTGAKSNTTESQVVETKPGTLMLNMRDNRGGYRSVATTTDMGHTWMEHITSTTVLPDPVCMAGFTKSRVNIKGQLRDVLFFTNVASHTSRNHTSVKASLDLGETWPVKYHLLLDERNGYGYSAVIKIDNNTIGIIYEGERDLYFLRVPVADIVK
jgi:sialidase-1